jgi:hypothetical protein
MIFFIKNQNKDTPKYIASNDNWLKIDRVKLHIFLYFVLFEQLVILQIKLTINFYLNP